MSYWIRATLVLLVALLTGCSTTPGPTAATAVPTSAGVEAPTAAAAATAPASNGDFPVSAGRSLTVLEAEKIAAKRATEWSSEVQLYEVVPSALTFRNLGRPMSTPGWFFRYSNPGSNVQFLIQIDDEKIGGFSEAEPMLLEPLPYELVPLDVSQLKLDSPEVMQKWRDANGESYLRGNPEAMIELRLSHIKGTPNPVWSIVDDKNPSNDLLSVDAVTGDLVERPVDH